jgi:hypothetical protein
MNETMLSEIIGIGFVIAFPWLLFGAYTLLSKETPFQKILREGREAEQEKMPPPSIPLREMKVMRIFDHPEHGKMVTLLEDIDSLGNTSGHIRTGTLKMDKSMKLEVGQIIKVKA